MNAGNSDYLPIAVFISATIKPIPGNENVFSLKLSKIILEQKKLMRNLDSMLMRRPPAFDSTTNTGLYNDILLSNIVKTADTFGMKKLLTIFQPGSS